jgi:hypothetical protein
MLLSFYQYLKESTQKDHKLNLVLSIIRELKSFSGDSYKTIGEYFIYGQDNFTILVEVRKPNFCKISDDSHFKDLPWEQLNYDSNGYVADANTYIKKDKVVIKLNIIVNPEYEPKCYSKLKARLIDLITHESNHVNQTGKNRNPFNDNVSEPNVRERANKDYQYFLLQDEIESMVKGMYASSNYQKIPLDNVFDEYLTPFVKWKYITQDEMDKIIQVWIKYALEEYPTANFSNKYLKYIETL